MQKDNTTRLEEAVHQSAQTQKSGFGRLLRDRFGKGTGAGALYWLLIFLLNAASVLLAFWWKAILDGVGRGGALSALGPLVVGYVLFQTVQRLLTLLCSTQGEYIFRYDVIHENRFAEGLWGRICQKLSGLSPELFEAAQVNDVIDRGLRFTRESLRQMTVDFYRAALSAVVLCFTLSSIYILSPAIFVLSVLTPLPMLLGSLLGGRLQAQFQQDITLSRRKMTYFEDLLRRKAVKELQCAGTGGFIQDKWEENYRLYRREYHRLLRKKCLLSLGATVFTYGASVAMILLAVWQTAHGRLTLGALGALMSLCQGCTRQIGGLYESVGALLGKRREIGQFYAFMDLPEGKKPQHGSAAEGSIVLQNVWYRYPLTDRYALQDITLTVEPGQRVALVGANGSGKSTLSKLLLGVLEPSRGERRYGVRPERLSAVFQDYCRYPSLTLRENVTLGMESGVGFDNLAAELDVPLRTAPDTLLGREFGGTELSGGQWQKVAIARGYYKGGEVMVLDEPTAAIDPLAERELYRQFFRLNRGKTVVVVTHRMASAVDADVIIVLKDGRIVERGCHGELLAQDGEYARMFRSQAKWYA